MENDKDKIQEANESALSGKNPHLADYLALNVALGLYTSEYLDQLGAVTSDGLNKDLTHTCFKRCREALSSGEVYKTLMRCREASIS